MIEFNDLIGKLGYLESSHYRRMDGPLDVETAHLFRAAGDAGVNGVYVFETSPSSSEKILAPRPAVYVAETKTEDDAKKMHRSLWNLGYAPFLIILLPHQVRVYTGFAYSQESENEGLLRNIALDDECDLDKLAGILSDFKASSIDTGFLWKSEYSKNLDQDQRVDRRLLRNLQDLGNTLGKDALSADISHALIGKYVYLSYLRSRGILTEEWTKQQGLQLDTVFSPRATVDSLRGIVEALENRFNGKIFPINFDDGGTLKDKHVSLVASIFSGAEIPKQATGFVRQLHLDFKAYDFSYIPVETLSAIYEQFIGNRKEKGAIYTPEVLADYVLSEMEWAKPLEPGMSVLDPACGSGVFLVLAYRRLIEKELRNAGQGKKLKAEKLYDILWKSIFGVEKEADACYVAEFSLILTLLHYAEPRELESLSFKFPSLHNTRIFNCDFFDFNSEDGKRQFWQQGLKFDWVTGNPPWIELKPPEPNTVDEMRFARAWMNNRSNMFERPVGGKRLAEAFGWLVTDLLQPDGIAGLVLPATSLFNSEDYKFRQEFFKKNEVLRVTNFANLREVLFGKDKSGVLPAITIVYRKARSEGEKPHILHYGPISVNQISSGREKPWVITINENEIKAVSPYDAESGEMSVWKLALWGTYRDRRIVERIRHQFPMTLETFCTSKGWGVNLPRQGAELRSKQTNKLWTKVNVKGSRQFNTTRFSQMEPRYRFSIPDGAVLEEITSDMFVRRGADTLRLTSPAPHMILSASWQNFAIYSDKDFIIPPRQMVIAAPPNPTENEDYLRALTVYLSSSLVAYYVFFQVPQWGVFSQRKSVVTNEVRKIPTPNLSTTQAKELGKLHREIVTKEQTIAQRLSTEYEKSPEFDGANFPKVIHYRDLTKAGRLSVSEFAAQLQLELQQSIDEKVFALLEIPDDIKLPTVEFIQRRLLLDKPSARKTITGAPTDEDLLAYARQLRDELDNFLMGSAYHRVTITRSKEIIDCVVEITKEQSAIPVTPDIVKYGSAKIADLLDELSKGLRERFSQWVYVQKGLRLYDGPRVHVYKTPRLIDWTVTQAVDDAADIIGTMVVTK